MTETMKKLFLKIKRKYEIRKAIRLANDAFLKTGKRHFVIEVKDKKLMVVNNDFVKTFNKVSNTHINFKTLFTHSLYATPLNGNC